MKKTSHVNLALAPQYIRYYTDGQGRDLYISSNSGGFCKKYSHKTDVKESFPLETKFKFSNVSLHPGPLVYRSDGSGRDSYILSECGTLRSDRKSLNAYQLTDFLRSADDHYAFDNKTNIKWVSKKEFEVNEIKRSISKGMIKRLYNKELPKCKERFSSSDKSNPLFTTFYKDIEIKKEKDSYLMGKNIDQFSKYKFNYFLKNNNQPLTNDFKTVRIDHLLTEKPLHKLKKIKDFKEKPSVLNTEIDGGYIYEKGFKNHATTNAFFNTANKLVKSPRNKNKEIEKDKINNDNNKEKNKLKEEFVISNFYFDSINKSILTKKRMNNTTIGFRPQKVQSKLTEDQIALKLVDDFLNKKEIFS